MQILQICNWFAKMYQVKFSMSYILKWFYKLFIDNNIALFLHIVHFKNVYLYFYELMTYTKKFSMLDVYITD